MVSLQQKQALMRRRNQLRRGLVPEEIGHMESEKELTIYSLIDPRDGKVIYVGATTDLAQRYRAHHQCRHTSPEYQTVMAELRANHLQPTLKVLECTKDATREAYHIGLAMSQGLVNVCYTGQITRRRNFAPNLTRKAFSRVAG